MAKTVRTKKAGAGAADAGIEGVGVQGEPPRTAAGCRQYMRGELTRKFPQIVEGFVEAAKTGSCTHVKLATELLKATQPKKARRPASVTALLKKMAG
jgi:hypothetical protein